ncbi:hypothetical protein LCGC14_1978350 [marine sediment metagenome]|uniref:Uncharacterized protein n=1 Tax=marine sediment metagenome TaxID=412755 RepID=A0A0F9I6M9_9ZZZZ
MKKLLAIWLVFYKGYSVVRLTGDVKKYGACNVELDYDYGHNGKWGVGNTPFEAVLDCYNQVNVFHN